MMLDSLFIYFLQAAQTTVTATPAATTTIPIDLNTLVAALIPLGGLAYAVLKTLGSKLKKSEDENLKNSANMIEQFVLPALQQNKKFVEHTQGQDVKIEQIAENPIQVHGR